MGNRDDSLVLFGSSKPGGWSGSSEKGGEEVGGSRSHWWAVIE
jgi:hypothetical protein